MGLHDRAPDDPAQHVAAALVRRGDTVPDEERHPAAVVREHAMRLRRRGRVAVRHARLPGDPAHDALVAVRLVDGHDVLEDRGRPLEAHPRVDVLGRQRSERPVRVQLVLHEDEVPELQKALAAGASRRAVGLPAAVLGSPVVVELPVGPQGPGPPTDQKFSESEAGRSAPEASRCLPRARSSPRPARA